MSRGGLLAVIISIAACDGSVGGNTGVDVPGMDTSADLAPFPDRVDGTDTPAPPPDVPTPPDLPPDRSPPPPDRPPPPDGPVGPCGAECTGNECGLAFPGSGGPCLCNGECRPGEDYCIEQSPRFQGAVVRGLRSVIAAHPEYFGGTTVPPCLSETSCPVPDAQFENMRTALVAEIRGMGLTCEAEGTEEIRIRDNTASGENYDIITSAGNSNANYTSTCYPAIF